MSGTLSVWWGDRIAGELRLDSHGEMQFAYAQPWLEDEKAQPLSFSLPKQVEAFDRRACQPFFEGMLPEESQRIAIARALGVSAGNEFRLLEHLGGEVAGALTLLPEGEAPPVPTDGVPDILDDERLLALLDRLPIRPMLAGEGGLRLSLAGAQSKLPVLLVEGKIALPAPGTTDQPYLETSDPPVRRDHRERILLHVACARDRS